jgi:hypothetical protein
LTLPDILSVVGLKDANHLNIEVKTSNSTWEVASFYISKNEWSVAMTSPNYMFHLWVLIPKSILYIVSVKTIAEHVPTNNGDGIWQSVEIPYPAVCQKNQGTIAI